MNYPQIGRNKSKSLFIPTLDGGINTNKGATDIADAQLMAAENMTMRYGVLQTRPGLSRVELPADATADPVRQRIDGLFIDTTNARYDCKPEIGQTGPLGYSDGGRLDMFLEVSDAKLTLLPKNFDTAHFQTPWRYPEPGRTQWEVLPDTLAIDPSFLNSLGLHYGATFLRIQNITITEELAAPNSDDFWEYSGQRYTRLSGILVVQNGAYEKYADITIDLLDSSYGAFQPRYIIRPPYTNAKIYTPTTIINKALDGSNATAWEDYNLLTRAFKEEWTPRLSVVDSGDVIYEGNTTESTGGTVSIEMFLSQARLGMDETKDHNVKVEMLGAFNIAQTQYSPALSYNRITFVNKWIAPQGGGEGHFEMERGVLHNDATQSYNSAQYVNGTTLIGYFNAQDGRLALGLVHPAQNPYSTFYIQTITVTAYLSTDSWEASRNRLLGFKSSIRFGGARSGLESGTRLFLYGSDAEPNLIRWSGLSDDLYFPENNFVYVGGNDKIVALAKQESYLAVLKANETYAIEYTYDVSEKENKTTVYFPVTPIDPGRGCDCPGTIQLVNNRLVWAHSSGEVYCLIEANQFSERSIIRLGANISSLLRAADLKTASSADTGSRYLIQTGETIFSWEYEHRPLYIFASLEETQDRLVWFKWRIPLAPEKIIRDRFYYQKLTPDGYVTETYALTEEVKDNISGQPVDIASYFRTKSWHFGAPHLHKRITELFVGASGDENMDTRVLCHTDKFSRDAGIFSLYPDTMETDTRLIRPRVNKTLYFGLTVDSDAFIKISSITLYFDIFGGAK